jgi:Sugar transferases involved in lipopolysaccharide synthesis
MIAKGQIMYRKYIKRIFGLILAIIGFPFFLIIFIGVAPLIYLEDKGPVFYNGKRIGRDGKIYKMYKFRTMKINAPDIRLSDGSTYNGKNDPRVTKIGRILRETSLDETPQLLNIIKGEMSFIGPRPDPPDWLEKYPEDLRIFLKARPGITGYSQAYFRNSDDSYEKIVHDAYYAENITFVNDIKIFFKTIQTVLRHESIYREEDYVSWEEKIKR